MINVTIDGISVQVEKGATLLEAAQQAGVEIPTLCYLKDVTPEASCRMCLVEVEGAPNLCILCHRCVNTCQKIVGRGPSAPPSGDSSL